MIRISDLSRAVSRTLDHYTSYGVRVFNLDLNSIPPFFRPIHPVLAVSASLLPTTS